MNFLWAWLSSYPNVAATIFGVVGTFAAGVFGWIMKHPLEKQAVAITTFKVQITGYEALVTTLQARIDYFEKREPVRDVYEAGLLQQLRECEERYLRLLRPQDKS